jgi:hypothetical protein
MLIKTKNQFYELSMKGLCGNTPKVWWSLDDFYSQQYRPMYVTLRSLKSNSSFLKPIILVTELRDAIGDAANGTYVINEIPNPHLTRAIQGELTWVNGSWYLYYARSSEPMRKALEKDGRHTYGFTALNKIKSVATPSDFDDLMWIMDAYSEKYVYPVIEFTVFNCCVGSIRGRNTLIWEVRSTF